MTDLGSYILYLHGFGCQTNEKKNPVKFLVHVEKGLKKCSRKGRVSFKFLKKLLHVLTNSLKFQGVSFTKKNCKIMG